MKKLFACTFALIFGFMAYAAPETPLPSGEEILDQHLKAQGGKASLSKIHSMRIRGTIETKESTIPFTLIRKKPNKVRLALHYPQGNFVMAYDGTHVWKYLAGASPKAAEIVKGTEAALFKLNAPFFGYLLEPDRYDLVVKTVSWESFNGKEIYNVQVQIADGMRLDYAIDPETFRILRMTTYEGDRARNSVFSDFRPVDTLTEPFKTDVLENGEFDSTQIIQQFDINPGVTNAVFEYPQEAQTLQARRMEGSNPSA